MSDYRDLEQALARELSRVETEYLQRLLDYLGWPPDATAVPAEYWTEYTQAVRRVLSNHLQDGALRWLREWLDSNPLGLDWTEVVGDAATWSRESISQLAGRIVDNTRATVERIVADATESGYTEDDLLARLAARFGPVHAELVAVTETTRALSWAAAELQVRLQKMGVATVRRWLTAEDERVCPVCGPLDHTTAESGSWERAGLPDGPPAHPRCRCRVVVEYAEAQR